MRIVITGAAGRLGSILTEAWQGQDLIALDRADGDLAEPGPWQDSLAGADVVVHLAGAPIGFGPAGIATEIAMATNVLAAAAAHGITKVIHASSEMADTQRQPSGGERAVYAAAQAACEALVRGWTDDAPGRIAVTLRLGEISEGMENDQPQVLHWFGLALADTEPGYRLWLVRTKPARIG